MWNRLSYAVVMSLLPALGAFLAYLLLRRLTRLFLSWQRAATLYFALFVIILLIQTFGRMIPVSN